MQLLLILCYRLPVGTIAKIANKLLNAFQGWQW